MLHPEKYAPEAGAGEVEHQQRTRMKLIWKFNLVLLGIFVLGFVVAGYISYRALQANAREEILQNARLHDGSGAVDAQLHRRAGQAAARYADAATSSCRRPCPRSPPPSSSTSCARSIPTTRTRKRRSTPPTCATARRTGRPTSSTCSAPRRRRPRSSASATRRPGARCTCRGRSRSRAPRASSATARSRPRRRR